MTENLPEILLGIIAALFVLGIVVLAMECVDGRRARSGRDYD